MLNIYIDWVVEGVQRHQRFLSYLRQTQQIGKTQFQTIWKKYTTWNLIANLLRLYFWGVVLAIISHLIVQEHSYHHIWLSSLILLLVSSVFNVWNYKKAKDWTYYGLDRDIKRLFVQLALRIPFLQSRYFRMTNSFDLWPFITIQFNIKDYNALNNLKYSKGYVSKFCIEIKP
ncbi:MAG: hypothetical protein GY810_00120 [Aureispira sp.]|nr:hypothetical protein [Aureispira sp.]